MTKHTDVKEQVKTIYHQHKGRFGYRRITLAIRNTGRRVNSKTVLKLMRAVKLQSLIRSKKYQAYKGNVGKIAPNVLNREFKSEAPCQKWATDITVFSVKDKKLYLSPILDLFNGEVISYQLSESPNFKQVDDMLKKAFRKVKTLQGLTLHSDQGWQYQMKEYQKMLADKGIVQSMSRRGNCIDNAVVESFFGTIKSELFYLKKYTCIQELKADIEGYIKYYNYDRIRLTLNGMSPVQYRAHLSEVNY